VQTCHHKPASGVENITSKSLLRTIQAAMMWAVNKNHVFHATLEQGTKKVRLRQRKSIMYMHVFCAIALSYLRQEKFLCACYHQGEAWFNVHIWMSPWLAVSQNVCTYKHCVCMHRFQRREGFLSDSLVTFTCFNVIRVLGVARSKRNSRVTAH
jgi:hypothetical protein